ncbi:MAG: hypothetical protein DRO18_00090, partial [Thermoprotei archaeon]
PTYDVELLKAALVTLRVILRLIPEYSISFRELSIDLDALPLPPIRVLVWEPEASGISEHIDWAFILRKLDEMKKPPRLWIPLVKLVDSEVASIILRRGVSWDEIKSIIKSVIKCIGGLSEIEIGKAITYIRRPSRKLGLISLEILMKRINDENTFIVSTFDGERCESRVFKAKEVPYTLSDFIEGILKRVIDSNLKLLVSNEDLVQQLITSRSTLWLYEKALISGLIANPYKLISLCKPEDSLDVKNLKRVFGIRVPSPILIEDYLRKGKVTIAKKLLREYVEGLAKITFYAYLVYDYLRRSGLCKSLG